MEGHASIEHDPLQIQLFSFKCTCKQGHAKIYGDIMEPFSKLFKFFHNGISSIHKMVQITKLLPRKFPGKNFFFERSLLENNIIDLALNFR